MYLFQMAGAGPLRCLLICWSRQSLGSGQGTTGI